MSFGFVGWKLISDICCESKYNGGVASVTTVLFCCGLWFEEQRQDYCREARLSAQMSLAEVELVAAPL
jgi:hypothetical protein